MREHGSGSLVVMTGDKLAGIVTERDILHKVVAEGRDLYDTRVRDVMTKNLVTVDPDDNILTALRLMRAYDIRRLPVVKGGRLIGLLTEKHVAALAPELIQIADDWGTIAKGNGEVVMDDAKPTIMEAATPGRCEACGSEEPDLYEQEGEVLCAECLEATFGPEALEARS